MKFEIKRFRIVSGANTLKATADITLHQETLTPYGRRKDIHDMLTIHEVKLVEGAKGIFLSMPTIKRGDKYWPVLTWEDASAKQELEAELLRRYHQKKGEMKV